MKKAINQSTLSLVLNGISIIALVIMAVSLVSYLVADMLKKEKGNA